MWKEEYIEACAATRREELRKSMQRQAIEASRFHKDLLVKYFSERVAPGVHDIAAKKQGTVLQILS
jgi:hypothetical protein